MRLLIQHRSRYGYPKPASLGPHTLRLRPSAHTRAKVEAYRLLIEQPHRLRWQQDPYGNHVAKVHFPVEPRVEALDLLVELVVDVRPVNPFDFLLETCAEQVPVKYPAALTQELAPFLAMDDPALARGPRFEALDASLPREGITLPLLIELNAAVNRAVKYVIREEAGVYTPEECLKAGRASCRDSAMLLIALLRARGLAARFCSGYLVQLMDEGMLPDEPRGVSRDVVDLHAWCEVFLPGAGWVGLDATSGLLCGEGHIPLCAASTPALASPLEGTSDTASNAVEFQVLVGRLGHEARPTAPYTDEVWAGLLASGEKADEALTQAGLRLTVGGEPTFNAREGIEAPEWNGAALGPAKWALGLRLAQTLRERLAPGAVVLRREGKWYPGESLPRWALDLVGRRAGTEGASWSAAGAPLWPDREGLSRACAGKDVARFAYALAARLGLKDGVIPAYEDPLEVLRDEAKLPVELDARRPDLNDDEVRARLAKILSRGTSVPTGWALPLGCAQDDGWVTEAWSFRRGALHLLPGDSPVGLRLPLASLGAPPSPPEDPASEGEEESQDLWGSGALDEHGLPLDPRLTPKQAKAQQMARYEATPDRQARGLRTALTVEARDGVIFVFLPPMPDAARFEALVQAVDEVRVERGVEVALGGYPPPSSPSLLRFSVTPDPGVLEVNLPPSRSLAEYEGLVAQVFDAALHAGLHSEKYMLDGRLAGSGGGHHITLGGPAALESPWLRRPDLLASLLTFVQHHPSLSYLFAGLFVGPTSQAPRVDEARHDTLYELEIALARAFRAGRGWGTASPTPPMSLGSEGDAPPWLGDILFRHLLTDLTGNTHRAELSIDKLYDWQTPYGRQGLVELRAFEMPPHPRMMVAQVALVRALVAAFAREPYQHPLVRWGQGLHDRFLLPWWMWRDMEDVLGYLERSGVGLPKEAYKPFVELRCPLVGRLQAEDVVLELRNAVEPWHVLGEELTAGGTARFVDSSVERVEVRALNLVEGRHAVLVNGHRLPLRAVAEAGTGVAGVRFRAWAPPHSLHPHLGIHHPLRLEVVDLWSKRSLGGCAYHVWHPEGRAFDAPPLTRFEASARRAQRFTVDAHTPWPVLPREAEAHPDAPWTLDLRRLSGDRPMPRPVEEVEEP